MLPDLLCLIACWVLRHPRVSLLVALKLGVIGNLPDQCPPVRLRELSRADGHSRERDVRGTDELLRVHCGDEGVLAPFTGGRTVEEDGAGEAKCDHKTLYRKLVKWLEIWFLLGF